MKRFIVCLVLFTLSLAAEEPATTGPVAPGPGPVPTGTAPTPEDEEPPEGYYAFVESPNATPPRVRGPPYRQVSTDCPGLTAGAKPQVSANNLCGDLNRGAIPKNPMGQSPGGEPYPFELLRNHTLRFLSRTLPVLRADDTLPRVALLTRTEGNDEQLQQRSDSRRKRSADASSLPVEHRSADDDAPRESRKFCDGGGVFCMLYRAINGDSSSAAGVERREDPGPSPHAGPHTPHTHPRYEGPPTPCPARVEYATPVFARNYQGVWRYVVQIPYEGYFTQTVEVTRCMQSRCHYLEGGCLSSPRWVSLLVAELHYPQEHQNEPTRASGAAVGAGGSNAVDAEHDERQTHCDGHDHMGCYQVRLYYDWFLVPGSCKCWRPDYFARYVRRRHSTNEL